MPEQTPEGPVPADLPLAWDRLNTPLPLAMRGPATAFILVCPGRPGNEAVNTNSVKGKRSGRERKFGRG